MSKSECDDQEWSVVDDSPINPAGSPSCIDSDFEDLASPQPTTESNNAEEASVDATVFGVPLPALSQQPIADEIKQDVANIEAPVVPLSQPIPIHFESVDMEPQAEPAEEPRAMSGSDTPSSPQSSVLDHNPCSPSLNAVLEFPSSAPQSESELEDDQKQFDLDEQEAESEGEKQTSFLKVHCPVCSRFSSSVKQCSFCCFELQWDCPRCTFINSFADDACLMCGLGSEPNQPTQPTTVASTANSTLTESVCTESEDVDDAFDLGYVSFFKDSDRRRCAADTSVKRQKDRVAVKVSIPLQFNLLNQPTRVLNEEAERNRKEQDVREFNVEDITRIRSLLGFKASNSPAKRDAASSQNEIEYDEEFSEHVRSVLSRRNAKARAAKSKRSQAKLNSHDKRVARSAARHSLARPFDFEDLITFRQQCADRNATGLLNGTLFSRSYWRTQEDMFDLTSIRTIPLPDSLVERFFEKCKSVCGKRSKYTLSLCMQNASRVHPSLRERLTAGDDQHFVVFAVVSDPRCIYHVPADHELPLFEVKYTYRCTEKIANPSVYSDEVANRTTLAQLHKMADRLRSKAFFNADLVRHSEDLPVTAE